MTECQETFLRIEVDAKMFIESKAKSSASYVDLTEGKDNASKIPLDHDKGISNMQSVTPQASEESQCISSNHQALPEDNAQQSISTANDQHNEAINEVINSSLNYSGQYKYNSRWYLHFQARKTKASCICWKCA